MDYNDLTAWGAFLSGLGTLVVALLGAIIVALDLRLRRRQLRESVARAEATLNVDVEIEVLPYSGSGSGGGVQLVLETRVQVKNNGHENWCIPAVYVSARSLVDPDAANSGGSRFYESDVERLPRCGLLSEPRNAARLERSVYQVAPDEVERFVRWDILDRDFVNTFPIIAVHVAVVSVHADWIGISYSRDGRQAPLRREWLDYMNGSDRQDHTRHRTNVFGRATEDFASCDVAVGDRVLLNPETGLIDHDVTRLFRELLRSALQTDRHKTVVLQPVRAGE